MAVLPTRPTFASASSRRAPSPEPGDDWRRKSDRHAWAEMADSPRQPDSVPGAIDHSFLQTLAISPLGHRQTLARGIYLSSRGSGLRGTAGCGGGGWFWRGCCRFSFPFFRPFRVRLRLRSFKVTRAGPEHPDKTKPECRPYISIRTLGNFNSVQLFGD